MSKGFFFESEVLQLQESYMAPRCASCGLDRGIKSPRMAVTGKGKRKILVVAEAPGALEDKQGTQLVGPTGQLLRKELRRLDVDLDRDCWKTNALICFPNDKALTLKRVKACRYHLLRIIKELEPETTVLLGEKAVVSLIGWLWGETVGKVGRWTGWQIPCQRLNSWVCPTWHPAYLLREDDPVLELWFRRHLKAAMGLCGRPWPDGVPNYSGAVERLYDPLRASERVLEMLGRGGTFAFDFETDRLKPDHQDASIISCSICRNGEETIAFPWAREAILAMGKLLKSRWPKWGWNIKFEDRWTRKVFGCSVRGWQWDGMQAAHILDNRPAISGLKFQSFARLGMASYAMDVKSYIGGGDGGNDQNRLREVGMEKLLLYNGLDSLLTWKIIEKQRKEMGCGQLL